MAIDYSKLLQGQKISDRSYVLDAEMVSRYRDAVGDPSRLGPTDDGEALAPPMAVAALSLRGVVTDLAIPGGTLHAGQELKFIGSVPIGETLYCRATVLQNSVRGTWRFLVVGLEVDKSQGRKVLEGKSTIMLPAEDGPRAVRVK